MMMMMVMRLRNQQISFLANTEQKTNIRREAYPIERNELINSYTFTYFSVRAVF